MNNPDLLLNERKYNKSENLESLNMFKGQLYETIVTTQDSSFNKNAAPIGVICKDSKHIVIYLNNCKNTQNNIIENGELIVNITKDPLTFTYSTIGNLKEEYFDEYNGFPVLKDNLGFFKANVIKIRETKRENDANDIGHVVTCKIEDIYARECNGIIPLNRAMNAVIESLVYYCRFDGKYKDKQKEIWAHMKELNRVCQKVGNKKEKESMKIIMKKMKENYSLE